MKKWIKYFFYFLSIFFLYSLVIIFLLKWFNPKVTSYINIKSSKSQFALFYEYNIKMKWVSLNNINHNLIKAVLISEDQKFYVHHGFDVEQIERAVEEYNEGRRLRGASTITQQLARNIFLWPAKNLFRKALESYYTFLLELVLSKNRILELYLNTIETGKNIYGIEAASKYYFGKSAKYLSSKESALIAACLPNPIRRNPRNPSLYLIKRSRRILQLMKDIKIPH